VSPAGVQSISDFRLSILEPRDRHREDFDVSLRDTFKAAATRVERQEFIFAAFLPHAPLKAVVKRIGFTLCQNYLPLLPP
jgi:hypothetical protein